MSDTENIFGCFVSITQPYQSAPQETKDLAQEQGQLFRAYIWREKGICDMLKQLKNKDYGGDLSIVLFQFYVNPLAVELQHLKEIEPYRKTEKSIGIPIIINNENFFSKLDEERHNFLKQTILQKLDLLGEVVKKKKLDTNTKQLKYDLRNVFMCF